MNGILIYPAGNSPAIEYSRRELSRRGYEILHKPAPDATHLLLPVPSFEPDGRIRGGEILEHLLADLPEDITVIGGNLAHPALHTYKTLDLLSQPGYVTENADITADCAIRVAAGALPTVFKGCRILILGWGRIGKCLAVKLKALGAQVTVAARKSSDRALLETLGYGALPVEGLGGTLYSFRVIFNTIPVPVLSEAQAGFCQPECVKIELASRPGIAGPGVISAKGLPGRMAPEASGLLIAKTIIRTLQRKEGAV